MRIRFSVALLALVAGCADRAGQSSTADTSRAAAPAPAAAPVNVTFDSSLGVGDLATMHRTRSGAYYRDVTVGTGTAADSGSTVTAHYRGQLPNGTQFDASQPPGPPITYRLGVRQVVTGFDEGTRGMRAGGRRILVIPPELGYGAAGNGPVPPNSYMVFTLDLVSVQP